MKSEKAKSVSNPENKSGALVKREELLRALDEVSPGLAKTDIIEQATCFVFRNGRVITYNEEMACTARSGLPADFRGAVPNKKFLELLRKIPDEELTISFADNEVVIRGKRKRAHNVMGSTILLPVDVVKLPEKWDKVNPDLTDAIGIVQECATKDLSDIFQLTCIHVHPNYIEAFDNHQLARYRLKTGVKEAFLLKREQVKALPKYDLTHQAVTDKWFHLKTANDTVISLVRYVDEANDYQNLSDIVGLTGSQIALPKSLAVAADTANVYSSEHSDNNQVLVELSKGEMKVTGRGDSGRYVHTLPVKYKGPDLKFQIAPSLLIELLKRDTICQIADYKLKVDGGKFVYLACLEKA